jgi:cation-transporting ATPase 13A3/4/5
MMSVVVRNLKTNKIYVFAKGAPERINSITLDRQANLQESVDGYAKKGLRVLAVAYKEVDAVPQTRSQCESELTLLGLLLLENNLKPDTAVIISNLSKANYNLKIISGDNPLTTISCAY